MDKEQIKKVVTTMDKWRLPVSIAACSSFEDVYDAIDELLGVAKKTGDETAISALKELRDTLSDFVDELYSLDSEIYEAEVEFAGSLGIDAEKEHWV